MTTYTLILMFLLVIALSWFLTTHIVEERRYIKKMNEDEQDRLERAERLRRLTNYSIATDRYLAGLIQVKANLGACLEKPSFE